MYYWAAFGVNWQLSDGTARPERRLRWRRAPVEFENWWLLSAWATSGLALGAFWLWWEQGWVSVPRGMLWAAAAIQLVSVERRVTEYRRYAREGR